MKINSGKIINIFDRLVPKFCRLPLISCFLVNCVVYYGSKPFTSHLVHYDLTTAIDRAIPFVPAWSFWYLGCYIFWVVNFIIIARSGREECRLFVTSEIASKLICGVLFFLLPTMITRPQFTVTGPATFVMKFIYTTDEPVNLFPSIHCLESWFCYRGLFICKKIPRSYRIVSLILVLLIFASTLFTKQHFIVDVAAGAVLAELCFDAVSIVYKRAGKARSLGGK